MKNFIQSGDTLTILAPADVVSGQGVKAGTNLFGVAVASVLSGEDMALQVKGVVELPKLSGLAVAVGDALGWDVSANELVAFGSGDKDIEAGIVVEIAAGGAATAKILLERPVLA